MMCCAVCHMKVTLSAQSHVQGSCYIEPYYVLQINCSQYVYYQHHHHRCSHDIHPPDLERLKYAAGSCVDYLAHRLCCVCILLSAYLAHRPYYAPVCAL